jgi:hypothetical protein
MPKGGRRATSWKKGESGNIAGRPKRPETIEAKKIVADVKAAAREHTQVALDTLKAVMSDAKAPPAARVSAATAMLDRGWGRAKETVDANVGVSLEALILASMRPTGQRKARHGIQVNDHFICSISRRNWVFQLADLRRVLMLPLDLLARRRPSAKRRTTAMFLAPWPAR